MDSGKYKLKANMLKRFIFNTLKKREQFVAQVFLFNLRINLAKMTTLIGSCFCLILESSDCESIAIFSTKDAT